MDPLWGKADNFDFPRLMAESQGQHDNKNVIGRTNGWNGCKEMGMVSPDILLTATIGQDLEGTLFPYQFFTF
jgi:hypothetical protein